MNNRVQGVRTDPKAYRTVYNVKPVISTVIHLYSALENTRLYPSFHSANKEIVFIVQLKELHFWLHLCK